jgi:hypothetical protein
MFELLGTVLTGGATGIIGSVIGKAFGFLDYWVEAKKADKDHSRTLEMLELQSKLGAEESERELAIAEATAASSMRLASYGHDAGVGVSSTWVVDLLRLVRPCLTIMLITLVGILYFQSDAGGKATIEASVIFMCSSAVLWWFGDRANQRKK